MAKRGKTASPSLGQDDSFGAILAATLEAYHGWRSTVDAAPDSSDGLRGQTLRAEFVSGANVLFAMLKGGSNESGV